MSIITFGIGRGRAESPVVTFGLGRTSITLIAVMMVLSETLAWTASPTELLAFTGTLNEDEAFTALLGATCLTAMMIDTGIDIDMALISEEAFAAAVDAVLEDFASIRTPLAHSATDENTLVDAALTEGENVSMTLTESLYKAELDEWP